MYIVRVFFDLSIVIGRLVYYIVFINPKVTRLKQKKKETEDVFSKKADDATRGHIKGRKRK